MNRDELKSFIKGKFGTLRKFAQLAGMNYAILSGKLNKGGEEKETIKEIYEIAKETEVKTADYELTSDDCKVIKESIIVLYGTVQKFANQSEDWSQSAVSSLSNCKSSTADARRKTKRVIKLVKGLISEFEKRSEGLSDWEIERREILKEQLKKIVE